MGSPNLNCKTHRLQGTLSYIIHLIASKYYWFLDFLINIDTALSASVKTISNIYQENNYICRCYCNLCLFFYLIKNFLLSISIPPVSTMIKSRPAHSACEYILSLVTPGYLQLSILFCRLFY